MTVEKPAYVAAMRRLAHEKHAGQTRWGGEPYVTHPEAVAALVAHLGPEYEAAALGHDLLEDTDATVDELTATGAPQPVVTAVVLLTHGAEPYLVYLRALATNAVAAAVKLADLAHNLSTADPTNPRHRAARTKWQLAEYVVRAERARHEGKA